MNKMREEFEAEMRKLGMFELTCGKCPMDVNKETGEYMSHDTNAMWVGFVIGWQASRAALCVELPTCRYEEHHEYMTCVIDALEEAGINYK